MYDTSVYVGCYLVLPEVPQSSTYSQDRCSLTTCVNHNPDPYQEFGKFCGECGSKIESVEVESASVKIPDVYDYLPDHRLDYVVNMINMERIVISNVEGKGCLVSPGFIHQEADDTEITPELIELIKEEFKELSSGFISEFFARHNIRLEPKFGVVVAKDPY